MHSSVSRAQVFHYAPFETNVYFNDVSYIMGKEDDNIIIWLYKFKSRTLQVILYTSDMKPLSKKTLVLHDIDQFNHFSFVKKTAGHDIVLQYFSKSKAITRLYSFDKNRNDILAGQILEESDVYTQLIIKQSADNNYTGFLKGYKTVEDSLLIQYSLIDATNKPIYQTNFVVSYKYRSFNLEDALIDNSGNLFFYTLTSNNKKDTQTIEIYEINTRKDSLFTNQITRQSAFWGIHIKLSDLTGLPCVSGILTEPLVTSASVNSEARYFFLQQLSEGLIQQNDMILVPFPPALDSSHFSLSGLEVTNFVESKDSSYFFYIGGLLNGRYQGNVFNESALLSTPNPSRSATSQLVNRYYEVPLLPSPFGSFLPNMEYIPPVTGNMFSMPRTAVSGENFFSTATVTWDKQLSRQIFKDTSQGNTSPEFETVTNSSFLLFDDCF